MSVDISKIKRGDEILVNMVVMDAPSGSPPHVVATVNGGASSDNRTCLVAGEAIVSHTPKALEVGDRVSVSGEGNFDILAINDGWAWLRRPEMGRSGILRSLAEMERIP